MKNLSSDIIDAVYDHILQHEFTWKIDGVSCIPTREQVADMLIAMLDSVQPSQSVMSGRILVQRLETGQIDVYVHVGEL